jgi:hypothetical protein
MGTWFWGQQDAFWISFYDFGSEIGVNYSKTAREGLNIWKRITKSCHWFYPFSDFCLISDKPVRISRDEQGRLHDDSQKAIEYSDGWGFCSVHGVVVPDYVIESPNEINTEKIESESNSEIRRVMLDRFGWDRYILETDTKPIDKSEFGILYRKEIPDDEPCVMVRLLNRTPSDHGGITKQEAVKIYGEVMVHDKIGYGYKLISEFPESTKFEEYIHRVPSTIKTAHEAVAWIAGVKPEAYKPMVQS